MAKDFGIGARHQLSRRAALAGGAAAMAAGAAGAKDGARSLEIGLQLYSINQSLDQDFEGSLRKVAQIGYRYVEFAGLHGRTPAQFRSTLDGLGLSCPSAHFPPDEWVKGTAGPIATAKALGAGTVVCPMPPIPERLRSRLRAGGQTGLAAAYDGMTVEDWRAFAALLNRLGAAAKAAGLGFAYHNHNIDFRDLGGGRTPWDVVTAETDPHLVDLEVDLGWVVAAGRDPVALLQRWAPRVTMVHLKDLKPTPANFGFGMNPTEVGSGVIDWRRVLAAVARTRARFGFVEQEPPYVKPQLESARISFEHLTKLLP
jgi:sugar phosphate isomerase/epimerase